MVQALSTALPSAGPVTPAHAPAHAAATPTPATPPAEEATENTADFAQSLQQAQRPAAPRPAGKPLPQPIPPRPVAANAQGLPAAGEAGPPAKAEVPEDLAPTDPATAPEGAPADLAALLAHLRGNSPAAAPTATAAGAASAAGEGPAGDASRALEARAAPAGATARQMGADSATIRGSAVEKSLATAAPAAAAVARPAVQQEQAAFSSELARAHVDVQSAEAPSAATAPALPLPAAAAAPLPAPAGSSPAAPVEAQLAARPGSEAFAPQFSAQISTFVRDGVEHARLHLNPAEMGPVTVQIQLDGQNAQVHLVAESGQTRQALEQAMPQLAGTLREAGLTLTGGGVFQQPRQAGGDAAENGRPGGRGTEAQARAARNEVLAPLAAPAALRPRGVVDLIA